MQNYSFGSLIMGVICLIAGTLIVVHHRKIAETMANGVASYDKVKLFGLCACGIGIILIANLHVAILNLLLHLIMPNWPR